jgi:hypothetical protein
MSDKLKEEYIFGHVDTHISKIDLKFVGDQKYFDLMDKMLEHNVNQKFYISTDLPLHFIENFKEKYGSNILTRTDFEPVISDYLTNSNIRVEDIRQHDTFENIIDLFSLSFCKMLIRADNSTWSEFAQYYRNQPTFSTNDSIDYIIDTYKNPAWGQPGDYNFDGNDFSYKKLKKTATK